MCVVSLPTEVQADADVPYLNEAGILQTVTATAIVSGGELTLNPGWYLVDGNVTRTETITVNGDVHLILADGGELTVTTNGEDAAGINVSGTNSLTIYGQTGGTGVLNAMGRISGAGIGGGDQAGGGKITINGGTVNATGGSRIGAGIGGGYGGAGGEITISGGTVVATGGPASAGIGGGLRGDGGTITINGGKVTATGGTSHGEEEILTGGGAGIGGGGGLPGSTGGTITISGDSTVVEATGGDGGAGIGGGCYGRGSVIIINNGTVTAEGGKAPTMANSTYPEISGSGAGIGGGYNGEGGEITIEDGTVKATGGEYAAGIGGGNGGSGGTILLTGGTVFAQGCTDAKDVGGGAEADSDGSLNISGTAALFLRNDTYDSHTASPTTTTHARINLTEHTADVPVYGNPVAWGGDFGVWLRYCTLTFDAAGGVFKLELENLEKHFEPFYYGQKGATLAYPGDLSSNSNIRVLPTRACYVFAGWDPAQLPDSMPAEDMTVTAQWIPLSYTVEFDANGGTGTMGSIEFDYDQEETLPANGFSKTGYTFAG